MRRFCTFLAVFLFTLPFGAAISGCKKATAITFCNGQNSGFVQGQVSTVRLLPASYGVSLNYGEIRGQAGTPTASDCVGAAVGGGTFTYATTDMTIADINPSNGQICAGSWNRNSNSGIADFTTCTPTNKTGTAFTTASTAGITSNPVPVFVHPVVTSIVLGPPSTDCLTDPATNCSPVATSSSSPATCTVNPANGCCTVPQPTPAPYYVGDRCLSQGTPGQLVARIYQNGTTNPGDNVSCFAGHVVYTPRTAPLVTIDQNGLATANQPGSTTIAATISTASGAASNAAGVFSTCPPVSISLVPTAGGTSITTPINNNVPFHAVATDQNGINISSIALTYNSTTPITIPGSSNGVTPVFPGSASITASCLPPICNPSPFNEIGLYGNGTQVTSNPLSANAPGNSTSILVLGSTNSRYLTRIDFTNPTQSVPVQLPYVPNSLVLNQGLTTLYLGNQNELMVRNVLTLAPLQASGGGSPTGEYPAVQGVVLSVSPDNSTLVVSNPAIPQVTLYSTTNFAPIANYAGLGTRSVWTPDSQTVYITAGSQTLVHSNFTGWTALTAANPTDVTVTVPSVGAYFAGAATTAIGDCPVTSVNAGTPPQATTNSFYPPADSQPTVTDRVSSTNDGRHILGATARNGLFVVSDLQVRIPNGNCPAQGLTFAGTTYTNSFAPASLQPTAITGVIPSTDSAVAFFTYTGSGGVLPVYTPGTSAGVAGTLVDLPLLTSTNGGVAPTAAVSGAISTDNTIFFAGTSGDNAVHLITRAPGGITYSDSNQTIFPKLPDTTSAGAPVAPNLLVQYPRQIN